MVLLWAVLVALISSVSEGSVYVWCVGVSVQGGGADVGAQCACVRRLSSRVSVWSQQLLQHRASA
jgi:hypothetical protein